MCWVLPWCSIKFCLPLGIEFSPSLLRSHFFSVDIYPPRKFCSFPWYVVLCEPYQTWPLRPGSWHTALLLQLTAHSSHMTCMVVTSTSLFTPIKFLYCSVLCAKYGGVSACLQEQGSTQEMPCIYTPPSSDNLALAPREWESQHWKVLLLLFLCTPGIPQKHCPVRGAQFPSLLGWLLANCGLWSPFISTSSPGHLGKSQTALHTLHCV